MNSPQDRAATPMASGYGFHFVVQPQTFAQGVSRVTEALKNEGFAMLTEIDALKRRRL